MTKRITRLFQLSDAIRGHRRKNREIDRAWDITYLKVDPMLDGLHCDPRFADLVQRVGLWFAVRRLDAVLVDS